MSKDKISDYSETPGNNTDIGGINIAEGMLPSDVNNAIREQMAQLKKFQSGTSGESVTFVTANVTTANAGQVNVDNLRLDGNTLSSTNTNGDIELTPNGNGRVTTSALSATSPRVITAINDTNGNELFGVTATGSAVNEFTVANAATGNAPTLSATGSDTNIDINITPKGTGEVNLSKVDIDSGTIDGTTIGGSSAAAGTFTALTVNSNNISADNSLGFRNRIINGDMRIDQRNAGASVTLSNLIDSFCIDRYKFYRDVGGTFTAQRSTTAPSGFTNSLLITASTGASPSAAQLNFFQQIIEGFNVSDLGWGTASAKTITVSFWVRSSVTGTYSVSFSNSALGRAYVATFSIASANTFEYKTVTIPGDTSGTWLTTNGEGLRVYWDLGSGSNFNLTAGSWGGTWGTRTSGSVTWGSNTGATFYLTGVQLEVGSVATPFERRPFGTELALCQRYYQRIDGFFAVGFNSTTMTGSINFPIEMRSSPTITVSGALETTDFVTANFTQSSGNATISGAGARVSARGVMTDLANFSSLTNHRVYGNLPQINRLLLSAEL
jgi:hypothetical protein